VTGAAHAAHAARAPRSGRGHRIRPTPRAVLLVAIAVGMLLYTLVPLRVYLGQRSQLSDLRRQTAQLEHRAAELTAQARQLQDPRYLERVARECLGMVRPGEIRFIVVPQGGRPAPPNC
jgi:cell division protein FtsB